MTIIAIIIFILTLAVSTFLNKGLPDCVSECYYIIGKPFTIAMWIVAGIMIAPMLDNTPDGLQPLAFLTCLGIAFVGGAAMFKDNTAYPIHKWSAIASAVCGFTWVSIINPWCLLCSLLALIGIADHKRWLLWCEIGCFASVFASVF